MRRRATRRSSDASIAGCWSTACGCRRASLRRRSSHMLTATRTCRRRSKRRGKRSAPPTRCTTEVVHRAPAYSDQDDTVVEGEPLRITADWLCPGVERDEAVRGFVVREQKAGGGDGGAAIGVELGVASIVKDDVGSESSAVVAVDFFDELGGDVFAGRIDPVAGHGVPGDGREAETARDAQRGRAARSIGRPKKVNGLACDLGE